jgi:hypothetical protein
MKTEDPDEARRRSKQWLNDNELPVYVDDYARNAFQGGLNGTEADQPKIASDMDMFTSNKIEMPCLFVSGRKDWALSRSLVLWKT